MTTSNPGEFPLWLLPLFPLAFVAMWVGICTLLAFLSGWPALAAHFKAAARPAGETISAGVAGVGWVSENRVTQMIVSPAGLYLYVNPLFRAFRPPLLLPWPRVRLVREWKVLWASYYVFDLAGVTSVTLTRRGYEAISSYAEGGPAGSARLP